MALAARVEGLLIAQVKTEIDDVGKCVRRPLRQLILTIPKLGIEFVS